MFSNCNGHWFKCVEAFCIVNQKQYDHSRLYNIQIYTMLNGAEHSGCVSRWYYKWALLYTVALNAVAVFRLSFYKYVDTVHFVYWNNEIRCLECIKRARDPSRQSLYAIVLFSWIWKHFVIFFIVVVIAACFLWFWR